MSLKKILEAFTLDKEIVDILQTSPELLFVKSKREIIEKIFEGNTKDHVDVTFDIGNGKSYKEISVVRCKNGLSVNFHDTYMRRRDPNAMVIADNNPTNKKTYKEIFSKDFSVTRKETFDWLKKQKLYVVPFYSGTEEAGYLSLALVPKDAAFFALTLGDLQGFVPIQKLPAENKAPRGIIFVAPPFRHTHFEGKQVVVHNRKEKTHEVFSYNLYPGPSAKKGVYSILLNIGETAEEKWTTLHCSTVKVVTPYECEIVIMHEGASGGGKTEMTQDAHTKKGNLLLARNPDNHDSIVLSMNDTCTLYPLTDDMGLVHPSKNKGSKLVVEDAENAWFLRVDHLKSYGTDIILESLCISPPEPLVFLNIDGKAGATALLWEHTLDAPDKPCPNPRVVVPRKDIPNIVNKPLEVDIRSFGVRTPRCTKENPTYGIVGMLHILPPPLAWLWRLVAPRGHSNPSIISAGKGLVSEGVGSYWPFATGTRVEQANILLHQIQETPDTKFVLIPNQFIGAYYVGFSAQWTSREILARRGGVNYKQHQLIPARCSLLGYTPATLRFSSTPISRGLLRVDEQAEVGQAAYNEGSDQIIAFFKEQLDLYLQDNALDPLGRMIIEMCLRDASLEDYSSFSERFFHKN